MDELKYLLLLTVLIFNNIVVSQSSLSQCEDLSPGVPSYCEACWKIPVRSSIPNIIPCPDGEWQIVFSDEFDSGETINTNNWKSWIPGTPPLNLIG